MTQQVTQERCVNFAGLATAELPLLYSISTCMITNDLVRALRKHHGDANILVWPRDSQAVRCAWANDPHLRWPRLFSLRRRHEPPQDACNDNICLKVIDPEHVRTREA
jgi:hypothetical protein